MWSLLALQRLQRTATTPETKVRSRKSFWQGSTGCKAEHAGRRRYWGPRSRGSEQCEEVNVVRLDACPTQWWTGNMAECLNSPGIHGGEPASWPEPCIPFKWINYQRPIHIFSSALLLGMYRSPNTTSVTALLLGHARSLFAHLRPRPLDDALPAHTPHKVLAGTHARTNMRAGKLPESPVSHGVT